MAWLFSLVRGGKQNLYAVPHRRGDIGLGGRSHRDDGTTIGEKQVDRVGVFAEGLGGADLVGHEQVTPLASELDPGQLHDRSGFGAGLGCEADRAAAPRPTTRPARMSGLRTNSITGAESSDPSAAWVFLILVST